ncbi:MAG: DNA modification methylase [Syntrophaceae bacterium]|nr:DNA modification methylase [Syntrophaceae bacterium]
MKNTYNIEYLPINNVRLNEKNPRLIKDPAFKRLVKSLQDSPELFKARPLICSDRTGELIILGGNMRYLAAKELHYTEVPVIIMTGLTEDQEKAIIIKDNGTFGEWDFSILESDWSDFPLEDWGVDLPENWLTESAEVIEDNFNAEAEAEKIIEPVTKAGDIWLLGNHRIMCGDSTKREDVDRLMGPCHGDLLLTDPPYGISIVGKIDKTTGKGQIGKGGKRYSPVIGDETTETARKIYCLSQEIGIKKAILWGGNYFTDFLPPSPCWIIWDKRVDTGSNNFADCEMAWTNLTSPARLYHQLWNGYAREGKRNIEGLARVHPTQKPVGLFAFCMDNYSQQGEIILDLFLGSGPALIAAEQLGRICYGMEMDPIYCDVICTRWAQFTGNKPILNQKED